MKKQIANIFFIVIAGISAVIFPQNVFAAPPANFQSTPIINTGLNAPTAFEFAPDGRIFILQRTGEVLIFKNGQLLSQPFTVLPSSNTGDRGLIGIAFDPDFLNNHWVYFYYNSTGDLLNYLVRFDASTDTGTNGPTILYHTNTPSEMLHQGGGMAFGPDGKLYLGIGDNGYHPNAQDLTNPFGKIVRLNKDGTIPTDNPFYNQTGTAKEIWAYGFRNPWRMQFDKSNGRLYASDVGEAAWEEINLISKGNNYGWPLSEGNCTTNCTGQTNPVYSYPHNGGSAAVTVGPVYRGTMFPASPYQGSLFYGDYSLGFMHYLTLDANGNSTGDNVFDPSVGSVVDLKTGTDGSLYFLTIFPASLQKIIYSTGNRLPVAVASANTTSGNTPLTVNFSSSGTNDPDGNPLTYLWDFGDGTTSTAANPQKIYANRGRYTVQLKVSDGTYTVLANPIVIQAGNPPTVTITNPAVGTKYNAGNTISFSSTATDSNGTALPQSAFTTNVWFHHQTHIHPFLGPLSQSSGSFTVPTTGEPSADTYFEIEVTVKDADGLTSTARRNVTPNTVNLTVTSNPTNLPILLDGIPTNTPQTIVQVVGFQREVRPAPYQQMNGIWYQFDHWSDNGSTVHIYTVPAVNSTLTAFYTAMSAYNGTYYNNTTLSGTQAFTRQDNQIDFNWGTTPPGGGLTLNNYSVRWEKNQYFASGWYDFTTTTDDGARLYIDNTLVIDKWIDQGTTSYAYTAYLAAGNHAVKMEYYQAYGGAIAKLVYDLAAIQSTPPGSTPTATPPPPTPTPTMPAGPTPTPTVLPGGGTELLTASWTFQGTNAAIDRYQQIPANVLSGKTILTLTYNLNGTCIVGGDASAIIFDQPLYGPWHYISLSNYGKNCFLGTQTVSIPLSDFPGLSTASPVGTFHGRFWNTGSFNIQISSAVLSGTAVPTATPTPTPPSAATPTPTPTPIIVATATPTPTTGSTNTELLTSPWTLSGTNVSSEKYQSIPPTVLQGKTTLTLTYDLHGLCVLGGDASAIIFDQPLGGAWHYISLSGYGTNCKNGPQTVTVPLSAFPGLDLTQPVGAFHARFWYSGSFSVDITSAAVSGGGINPTPPPPSGIQLLSAPWTIRSGSGGATDVYQNIDPMVLNGNNQLSLTYDLHGLCLSGGDASAIIFDQPMGGTWHYISLSNYGSNCLDGTQTVSIPLSAFSGLIPSQPVGTFHARFWNAGAYAIDITSAVISNNTAVAAASPLSAASSLLSPAASATAANAPLESAQGSSYTAKYWNSKRNTDAIPSGTPDFSRKENYINYDWRGFPADVHIDKKSFFARWEKEITTEKESYEFSAITDGGIKVYIDGKTVIDQWKNGALKAFTSQASLNSGRHTITVEYRKTSQGKFIQMTYNTLSNESGTEVKTDLQQFNSMLDKIMEATPQANTTSDIILSPTPTTDIVKTVREYLQKAKKNTIKSGSASAAINNQPSSVSVSPTP